MTTPLCMCTDCIYAPADIASNMHLIGPEGTSPSLSSSSATLNHHHDPDQKDAWDTIFNFPSVHHGEPTESGPPYTITGDTSPAGLRTQ